MIGDLFIRPKLPWGIATFKLAAWFRDLVVTPFFGRVSQACRRGEKQTAFSADFRRQEGRGLQPSEKLQYITMLCRVNFTRDIALFAVSIATTQVAG